MKKIYTYLMMAILALPTTLALTSCDQDAADRYEARTLDGTWTGYIDTYYYDRWGKRGDTFRTSIYFQRENAYGGTGYEIDYNVGAGRVDYYCEFRWTVDNGRIRIRYDDSWGEVVIYDYHLDDDYFEGYMDDGTTRDIHFRLRYDSGFNWNGWRNTWRRAQAQ
ncbi:MAG: hypothetical protein J1E37_07040 [Prevotella sp.]|nr:hypothetical protein [Prevotella sp.]